MALVIPGQGMAVVAAAAVDWDENLMVVPVKGYQEHVVLTTTTDGSAFAWAVMRLTLGNWGCCLPDLVNRRMAPPPVNNLNGNRLCAPPLAVDEWGPAVNMAAVITREGPPLAGVHGRILPVAASGLVLAGAPPLPTLAAPSPPGGAAVAAALASAVGRLWASRA